MRDNITDRQSLRTVVVRCPDGEKQFWLTEVVYRVGDEIRGRNGHGWVVEEVRTASETGHTTVTFREAA